MYQLNRGIVNVVRKKTFVGWAGFQTPGMKSIFGKGNRKVAPMEGTCVERERGGIRWGIFEIINW